MSFRKAVLLVAALAVATTVSAHAQFGVYGMFTVNDLSNTASSPLPLPPNATGSAFQRSNSVDPLGGTGGVYYDFKKAGLVTLGGDVRGSIMSTKRGAYINFNGPGARVYSVLGGVRAQFHPPIKILKPYVEGLVGLGRSDYGLFSDQGTSASPLPTKIYSNFEYQGLVGLDLKLLPIMDFRVVEFGYGGLDPFGTYSHNYPIKQVSSGFVFHLPY
jgi:hypothetical protein